jgi:hypothetical protein
MAQRRGHLATDQATGGSNPSECTHASTVSSAAERPPHTRLGEGSSPSLCTEGEAEGSKRRVVDPVQAGFKSRHPPRVGGRAVMQRAVNPSPRHRWFESIPAHQLPGSGSASEFPKLGCLSSTLGRETMAHVSPAREAACKAAGPGCQYRYVDSLIWPTH